MSCDARVIKLWGVAQDMAKEMGLRVELRGTRLFIVKPETHGEVDFKTAEAVVAYLAGYRSGERGARTKVERRGHA